MSDINTVNNSGITISTDGGKILDSLCKNLPRTTETADIILAGVMVYMSGKLPRQCSDRINEMLDQKKEVMDRTIKQIELIPDDKKCVPPIQVLNAVDRTMEVSANVEEIREMFASILSKACNVEYTNAIHPAFFDKIKQLSPLEAKLIKNTKILSQSMPCCTIRILHCDCATEVNESNAFSTHGVGVDYLPIYLVIPGFTNNETDFQAINVAVDNLKTLGLIEVHSLSSLVDDNLYLPFFHAKFFRDLISSETQNKEMEIDGKKRVLSFSLQKYHIAPTQFAKDFYKICIADD